MNTLFNALPDKRVPDDCLYTAATVLWLVMLGFLCRKGTRNAMDVDRNTGVAPANLLALSGQRRWPDGRPLTAPCTQTTTRFLDILAPGKLEQVLVAVVQTMLRCKLLDDALFACEAVFATCQQNDWKFILTFKEGSHPAAYAEALELLPLAPSHVARLSRPNFLQDTRWVDGVAFGARRFSVVFQGEADGTQEYFCAWVTDILIAKPDRAGSIAAAGRWRSRIEESYNVQKNGGFGLEHAFRETDRGAANDRLLMQLAHTLWQLLAKGWVRREMAACRKLTDVCLARLLAEALHVYPPPDELLPAFQLRFADG